MTEIPLNAKVECTDGGCGRTTDVIVNPVSLEVTHLALRDKSLPKNETRLVPADKVASVTPDRVTLNCSREDVAGMPPFVVEHLVQESPAGAATSSGIAYTSQYVFNDTAYDSIKEPDIPKGSLSIVSGMHIKASDGTAGKLSELVLDPKSGQITHLLVREGHLWNKKDVAIPVADVDFVDSETVFLKIDKKAVHALPDVKVKRP